MVKAKTKAKYRAIVRYAEFHNRKSFNLYSEDKDELISIVSKIVFEAYGVYEPVIIKYSTTFIGIIGSDGVYKEQK